jgi:hypothetical protein
MNITKDRLIAMKKQVEQERDQLIANVNVRVGQIALLEQQLKDLDAPEPTEVDEDPVDLKARGRNGKVPNV